MGGNGGQLPIAFPLLFRIIDEAMESLKGGGF